MSQSRAKDLHRRQLQLTIHIYILAGRRLLGESTMDPAVARRGLIARMDQSAPLLLRLVEENIDGHTESTFFLAKDYEY